MSKISSGINDLDDLIDSLYSGDNLVWEVEAGTSYEIFVHNFMRQSFADHQNVIYASFNKSPQSILQQIGEVPYREGFVLLDCFTSGKGKNDRAFMKFYENYSGTNVMKVDKPGDIAHFTTVLNSLEERFPTSRYIFDSLTGMQDLWGDESSTYKFFTYLCPRLYDLGTVAYWILEKEAHSDAFKANLRHITQVVLELYRRKEKLWIKALKIEGRPEREAFKPHSYEISGGTISITFVRKEPAFEIGSKIKESRTRVSMSQKELAEKVDLTPSFISQMESNQITPSLHSFIQICNALGVSLSDILESRTDEAEWLIRKEQIFSHPLMQESGMKSFSIVQSDGISGMLIVIEPYAKVKKQFMPSEGNKLLHILKGDVSVIIDGKGETLRAGDSVYLRKGIESSWKNEGGDSAEILLLGS